MGLITTAIITEINITEEGSELKNNYYKIEVPFFTSAIDDENDKYITYATACVLPGLSNAYQVGDLVYVGFVDRMYDQGLILGSIYQGPEYSDNKGALKLESLDVSGNVSLPITTTFGDFKAKDLFKHEQEISNLTTISKILNTKANNDSYLFQKASDNTLSWKELSTTLHYTEFIDSEHQYIDINQTNYTKVKSLRGHKVKASWIPAGYEYRQVSFKLSDLTESTRPEYKLKCEIEKNSTQSVTDPYLDISFTTLLNDLKIKNYFITKYNDVQNTITVTKKTHLEELEDVFVRLSTKYAVVMEFTVQDDTAYISIWPAE